MFFLLCLSSFLVVVRLTVIWFGSNETVITALFASKRIVPAESYRGANLEFFLFFCTNRQIGFGGKPRTRVRLLRNSPGVKRIASRCRKKKEKKRKKRKSQRKTNYRRAEGSMRHVRVAGKVTKTWPFVTVTTSRRRLTLSGTFFINTPSSFARPFLPRRTTCPYIACKWIFTRLVLLSTRFSSRLCAVSRIRRVNQTL